MAAFEWSCRLRSFTHSGSVSLQPVLTSFYSWRLVYMTFHGPRAEVDHHDQDEAEAPRMIMVMTTITVIHMNRL